MAGVLLTVNGKLVTSPKAGMEYGFYIDNDNISALEGQASIQGVSANQLYTDGISSVDFVTLTLEGNLSIVKNGSNYYFHVDDSESRSTPSFDVIYGTYAGYTVVGNDVFPRSLLTA